MDSSNRIPSWPRPLGIEDKNTGKYLDLLYRSLIDESSMRVQDLHNITGSIVTGNFLKLDQTTPQAVTGTPEFPGLKIGALAGILKGTAGVVSAITDGSSNWNSAYGWGDHSDLHAPNYLTATASSALSGEVNLGLLATGLLKGTVAAGVSTISSVTDSSTNWNTAYGWGNHASAGYITAVSAHDVLSATHGDTTAATVVRGGIVTGQGATPKWTYLAKGDAGKALICDATDVGYADVLSSVPTGLTYTTSTRALSLTTGYMIPGGGTAGQVLISGVTSAPSFGDVLSSVPTGLTYTGSTRALSFTSTYFIPTTVTLSNTNTGDNAANSLYDIGSDTQAYSLQLTNIAGLTPTDSNVIVGNGTTWVAESGATARTSLGLAIGSDVQAYNSNLTGINQALDTTASPSWVGATFSGLTASVPVVTGAGKALASVSYATFKTSLTLAQADISGLTTTDGPTLDHLHLTSGQIVFPATQAQSADANTLDDYEEGSAVVAFAAQTSGSITIHSSYNTITYVKVGRVVTISGYLLVSSVSLPVGGLLITGLPFSAGATYTAVPIWADALAVGAVTSIIAFVYNTSIYIDKYSVGTAANLAGDVQANTAFIVGGSYIATG